MSHHSEERKPLLGWNPSINSNSGPASTSTSPATISSSAPPSSMNHRLKPMESARRLTLQEATASAHAADLRKRIPIRIRIRLRRLAARARRRLNPDLSSSDEDGEYDEQIVGVPDLEAIFVDERSESNSSPSHSCPLNLHPAHRKFGSLTLPTHHTSASETSRLIASTLASSYGTLTASSSDTRSSDDRNSINSPVNYPLSHHGTPKPNSSSNSTSLQNSPLNGRSGGGSNDSSELNVESWAPSMSISQELFDEMANPVGKYRRVWLLVIFLFVLYNAIVIPFLLAFQSTWYNPRVIITLMAISYIGDICFCLDVALAFVTPYSRDGLYERNLSRIRHNYLSTWFVPDFISSAPYDLILLLPPFSVGIEIVLLVRLTRFIRFCKYDSYFEIWEQYSTRYPQGIRFFKLMLGLMLILHWLSCFWFYCGHHFGFGTTTWLPDYEFKHTDVTTQYIASLWWSTNIITQVGGDPGLPVTNFERMSDFFIAFIAVFIVAMVIGEVTALVSEMTADESELRKKLSILNQFMYLRKLPDELQERIRNYYFTLWNRRGVMDGDTAILAELPSNLRTEVSLIMNQDILGKVPIFQSSSPGFINSLVLHLKPQTFMPREIIVKQFDSGSEMYFIARGQVSVVANDKVVGRIGPGGFFGELSAMQEGAVRTATIIAVEVCDLFVLTHEDLQSLFRVFPAERSVIMHVAETRRAKDLLRKTLADPLLLRRELETGPAFEHHPVLVNLLIDLFQPLDLQALAERNTGHYSDACGRYHRRRHGGPTSNRRHHHATMWTLNHGLTLDEHGEIIGSFSSDDEEDDEDSPMLDDENEGVIFNPQDEAHTIYFIGKGCVDIFAHPELDEALSEHEFEEEEKKNDSPKKNKHAHVNGDGDADAAESHRDIDGGDADDTHSVASDATTEDGTGGPQHVIRLTEGHFFGAISSEHYRVSAVIPTEYRNTNGDNDDAAIIFALTSHDLPKLHDYYLNLPPSSDSTPTGSSLGHDRHHMKRALITWLQRHRTPVDYVRSMVSLALTQATPSLLHVEGRASKNWKVLLKMIATKTRRRPTSTTPSQASQHHQQAKRPSLQHSVTLPPASMHERAKHYHHSDDEAEEVDEKFKAPLSLSTNHPLIKVSPAELPSSIQVEPYNSASGSPIPPTIIETEEAANASNSDIPSSSSSAAASSSSTAQPSSSSSSVSSGVPPLSDASSSSSAIVAPPLTPRSMAPSLSHLTVTSPTDSIQLIPIRSPSPSQSPTRVTAGGSGSGLGSVVFGSLPHPSSNAGLTRPALTRAVSAGPSYSRRLSPESVSALSPLLHRAPQTRGGGHEPSTQDVCDLLAQADTAHNTRHSLLGRVNEETSGTISKSSSEASIHTASSSSSHAAMPLSPRSNTAANLEWLISSAVGPTPPSNPSTLGTNHLAPTRSHTVFAPPVISPKPDLRKIPSLPSASKNLMTVKSPSPPTGAGLFTGPLSTRSISSTRSVSHGIDSHSHSHLPHSQPFTRHSREASQPFSFLLALPQSTPSITSFPASPIAAGASSNLASPLIPFNSSRVSASPGSFGDPSPSPSLSNSTSSSIHHKRGSGSANATPARRNSAQQQSGGSMKRSQTRHTNISRTITTIEI